MGQGREGTALLNRVLRQMSQRRGGVGPADIWGKGFPGRGNSQCEGPEEGGAQWSEVSKK